jgi:hypothetical protein
MGEVAAHTLAGEERRDGAVGGAARAGHVGDPLPDPARHRFEQREPVELPELGPGERGQLIGLAVAAGPPVAGRVDVGHRHLVGCADDGGVVGDLEPAGANAVGEVQPGAVVVDDLPDGHVRPVEGHHEPLVVERGALRHGHGDREHDVGGLHDRGLQPAGDRSPHGADRSRIRGRLLAHT